PVEVTVVGTWSGSGQPVRPPTSANPGEVTPAPARPPGPPAPAGAEPAGPEPPDPAPCSPARPLPRVRGSAGRAAPSSDDPDTACNAPRTASRTAAADCWASCRCSSTSSRLVPST